MEESKPDMTKLLSIVGKQINDSFDVKPAQTEYLGAYVQIGVETFLIWQCPNAKCQKGARSTDGRLVEMLKRGERPLIKCPTCGFEHLLSKPEERKIETAEELRKKGFNPKLSDQANRLLGNVRR